MHRIGETIGTPAAGRRRASTAAASGQGTDATFNKEQETFDRPRRRDPPRWLVRSPIRVRQCDRRVAGDVHGIKRPIAPDAAPMTLPAIAASVATSVPASSAAETTKNRSAERLGAYFKLTTRRTTCVMCGFNGPSPRRRGEAWWRPLR